MAEQGEGMDAFIEGLGADVVIDLNDPKEAARVVYELRTRIDRLLNRFEAAVKLIYPDDMTPSGKRIFDSIIQEERG